MDGVASLLLDGGFQGTAVRTKRGFEWATNQGYTHGDPDFSASGPRNRHRAIHPCEQAASPHFAAALNFRPIRAATLTEVKRRRELLFAAMPCLCAAPESTAAEKHTNPPRSAEGVGVVAARSPAARWLRARLAQPLLSPGGAIDQFRYCVALATGNGFAKCFRFSSIQLAARRSASAISSRLISPASFFLSLRLISIT